MGSESLNFLGLSLPTAQLILVVPLLLALGMAWTDMKTNRIPNYLTLGTALAGLGFQLGFRGWAGLLDGFLGIGLGFALLIFFYWKGGLGAGDVKALAALGAWVGPQQTFYLFIYMAISGGVLVVFFLWRRGLLWSKLRHFWGGLVNWVLLHSSLSMPQSATPSSPEGQGIPYATALAMGMAILCWRGFMN